MANAPSWVQAVPSPSDVRKVDFLSMILGRLESDVGGYLDFLREKRANQAGFWARVRLLMPVVEAVADDQGVKPWDLLGRHLNIATPSLVWNLFRHSLIHGDQMRSGKLVIQSTVSKRVGWGITLAHEPHSFDAERITISVPTLYEDLVTYLKAEIAKNDQTIFHPRIGTSFVDPPSFIRDDFNLLV